MWSRSLSFALGRCSIDMCREKGWVQSCPQRERSPAEWAYPTTTEAHGTRLARSLGMVSAMSLSIDEVILAICLASRV